MKYIFTLTAFVLLLSSACTNNNNDDDDDFEGYYVNYKVDGVQFNHTFDENTTCTIIEDVAHIIVGDSIHGIELNIADLIEWAPHAYHYCLYFDSGDVYASSFPPNADSTTNFNCSLFGDTVIQGSFDFVAYGVSDSSTVFIKSKIEDGELRILVK
jgi:hypothetical protein